MRRLFLALQFDEAFARQTETWLKKLRKTADRKEIGVRWSLPENFHVTLVFLGDTPEEDLPRIESEMRLAAGRHPGFPLKIRHVGAFPAIDHARVLWLGVQKSQALLDLQTDLENRFLSVRAPEASPAGYTPHLTFGRLRSARNCRDLLSPFQHADFGRQEAREILLFESLQTGPFTTYRVLARASLAGLSPEPGSD